MTWPFAPLEAGVTLAELASDPAAALDLGKAAEHLVCADLILGGERAFLSDQGLPYDLVVDVGGRLIRVQVKAACFPINCNPTGRNERIAYRWSVRRRGKFGAGERLSAAHCDVVALVALDIRSIAYAPVSACSETVTLSAAPEPGRFGFTMGELRQFRAAVDGQPQSLATYGRRAAVRRNGQLTLVTVGL